LFYANFRLDYISCALTVLSTVMVGRRMWQGWIVSAVNSVIVCLIGMNTGQWGFVPANIFCLAIYAYNLRAWREPGAVESPSESMSATLDSRSAIFDRARLHGFRAGDERITSHRIHPRAVPDERESRPPL
jgi:hypothetical protein